MTTSIQSLLLFIDQCILIIVGTIGNIMWFIGIFSDEDDDNLDTDHITSSVNVPTTINISEAHPTQDNVANNIVQVRKRATDIHPTVHLKCSRRTSIDTYEYLDTPNGEMKDGYFNRKTLIESSRGVRQRVITGSYVAGVKHGSWIDATGPRRIEYTMINGKKEGKCNTYRIDKLICECTYRNGKKDGISRYFSTTGFVTSDILYDNGVKVSTTRYKRDGTVRSKEMETSRVKTSIVSDTIKRKDVNDMINSFINIDDSNDEEDTDEDM